MNFNSLIRMHSKKCLHYRANALYLCKQKEQYI